MSETKTQMPKETYGDGGRLSLAHQASATSNPWWFKRRPYSARGNYQKPPVWHVFQQRLKDVDEPAVYVWRALCGYEWRCNAIFGEATLRDTPVKTETLRCAKCARALERREK